MLENLWQAALAAHVGIAIKTDDRKHLQLHLYKARTAADTDRFDGLSIIIPQQEEELWIVHRRITDASI